MKGYKTRAPVTYPKPKSRTAVFIVLAVLVASGVAGWVIYKFFS